jgi:soluble lytic murein transglycosylase
MRVWGQVAMVAALCAAGPVAADLASAMAALRERDWDTAAAEVRGESAAVAAIVTWHRLRAGEGDFEDYMAFLKHHGDWPGMAALKVRGEATIPADAPPETVFAFFGTDAPQTGDGVLRLTAALETAGRSDEAKALAIRAWKTLALGPLAESTLMAIYGEALADHQIARMDAMLWTNATAAVERQRPRVPEGWRALADARLALRMDAPGVDLKIAAVPAALAGDAGLAFERMEWRARRDRTDEVVALFLDRSTSAKALGRPEAWAKRRADLARERMRAGEAKTAYRLAARHYLTGGADYADLEWLAGFIALRQLHDPKTALTHFRNLRAAVASPISLGRAGYWEGRALEELERPADAAVAYAFAARYQTGFYGQLAAERAGLPMDPLLSGTETFRVPRHPDFTDSTVFEAGLALGAAGDRLLAARFLAHLAERLDRQQIGQLLTMTEAEFDDPYVQLQIAKRAAERGLMLQKAYFPVIPLPEVDAPEVAPELALAIARRESEFNADVISAAGARGLMQVMPATAEHMAEREDLPFVLADLTEDPAYNARLGIAYLQDLRDRFGDATVFVVAGYNAGPGRPLRWAEANGDPRKGAIDPVDWIELIPFDETRNYVMRVTEALAPYRARLKGAPVPLTLQAEIAAN